MNKYLILIAFLFLSNTKGSLSQDPILELRKFLLTTNPPNLEKASEILKVIRQSDESLDIQDLKNIKNELAQKTYDPSIYRKGKSPYSWIADEIEATIINLEIKNLQLNNEQDVFNHLWNSMRVKFKEKKSIDAEYLLLKEDATLLNNSLLQVIKGEESRNLKMIAISALKKSKTSNLEGEVLSLIERYSSDFPIYGRLISLLGKVGGEPSIQFFKNKIDSGILKTDSDFKIVSKKAIGDIFNRTGNVTAQNLLKNFVEESRTSSNKSPLPKKERKKESNESNRNGNGKSFSYPEERGEDFSKLSTYEVFNRLKSIDISILSKGINPKDESCINLRKIAQVLGDRQLAGTLSLNSEQRILIDNTVKSYLDLVISEKSADRIEVNNQMYRFWNLATPNLLKNIDNSNSKISDFASQKIIEMRSEKIIKAIIKKALETNSKRKKENYAFILKMMKNQYKIQIPNRQSMSKEETEKLYNELIEPALEKLKEK
ncbi:MAG: hypothetical protein ACI86M_003845 [Saprospiraceae bacterium]|jgi:hypothetical protein